MRRTHGGCCGCCFLWLTLGRVGGGAACEATVDTLQEGGINWNSLQSQSWFLIMSATPEATKGTIAIENSIQMLGFHAKLCVSMLPQIGTRTYVFNGKTFLNNNNNKTLTSGWRVHWRRSGPARPTGTVVVPVNGACSPAAAARSLQNTLFINKFK